MDIEDLVKTTTHIKIDTKTLQKRLNKRRPNRKGNNKSYPKKMKHKQQKLDINQFQEQRKKKKIKNRLGTPQ